VPVFSNIFGGAVTVVKDITEELAKRGHKVTIVTSDAKDRIHRVGTRYRVANGVEIYYMKNLSMMTVKFLNYLFITPEISNFLESRLKEYDLIHMHSYRSYQNIVVYKYAKKYRIPYIVQPHGGVVRNIPHSVLKYMLKLVFDHAWGYKILRDASKIIALCKDEERLLNAIGIPRNKIVVLPNGIDLTKLPSIPRGRFRSNYDIHDDAKIVLYVGRISPEKGLDFLLKSFVKLVKIHKENTVLVIVGPDMGYLQNIMRLAKMFGVDDKVIVVGPLPHDDRLFSAYADADIVVIPSEYEAFPKVVLEAYAYGKPIIATKTGALKDVVLDGVTGFLVEYGDVEALTEKMRLLINDEHLTMSMGKAARKLVEQKFTLSKIVQKLEEVYRSAL